MENKEEELNRIVYKGILPIAFLNTTVIQLNDSDKDATVKKKKTNKKYNQTTLPNACSSILISKIYEIY